MTETARTGRCLCGAVRYTLAEPATEFGACHCSMCRRFTGGIELGVQVQPGGVTFEGEEALRVHASSDWAERGFCGTCGSSLFWRLTAPGPMQGLMSVTAGTLDSLEGLTFASEVYIDAKPSAYAFAGTHSRLTEAETLAEFGVEQTP
jgi:hypothetical protein